MDKGADVVVPDSFRITKMEKYGNAIETRDSIYSQAENSLYQPGQIVKFIFPSVHSDFRRSLFSFKVNGTVGTGGSYTRFDCATQGMSCIIERVRILFGSTSVLDINDYNLLDAIVKTTYNTNWVTGTGALLEGCGSTATRATNFADPTRTYMISLAHLVHLFDQPLPLLNVASAMSIEITLAPAAKCIESDHTGFTYNIIDCEYHYDYVGTTSAWDNYFKSFIINQGSYQIPYRGYQNYQQTFAASATTASSNLPFNFNAMLGLSLVMRNSADVADATVDNKLTTLNYNAVISSKIRLNNIYYPTDSSRSLQDLYYEYLKNFGKCYEDDVRGGATYGVSSFVDAYWLARHSEDNRENVLMNGLQTSGSGTSVVKQIEFGAGLAAEQLATYFAEYNDVLKIFPNGSVQHFM